MLTPSGVLAVWTYGLMKITPDIDKLVTHLYAAILKDHWAMERTLVEEGYASVHLPFKEISSPEFHMSSSWSLAHLLGYLETWSAVKKYQRESGVNPVAIIYEELVSLWGDPQSEKPVVWPLSVRIWINES